ncbi:MAG: dihydroorotate dehydrogenase (quinone) [Pelagibacteraceae bacterium]|nr:dihydroorotate dehydrogenase (quinone) [Pelagibacteraceae bacterium]|tara:strand:- start:26804 stop:27856 length:1053 start_codon:yes stop_codon:yes gene_type:complete
MLISLLRLFPPEVAHQLTITILKSNFSIRNKKIDEFKLLKQNILGIDFPNPLGLAAGFDKNAEVIRQMIEYGFGFVEVGTVTPNPQKGNQRPRIFRLHEDEGIINHLGFNNKGSEKILKNLKKINQDNKFNGVIGINIGKNKSTQNDIDDYLYCIEKIGSYGNYITINISSPNTPGLRDLQLRGRIENLVKNIQKKQLEVEQLSDKPIFIKISPDLDDEQLRDIALMALANNVNGLIISNSTIKRPKTLISSYRNEIGGLSGKPIFLDSTIVLKKLYLLTNGQIPLIGVGGVSNGYECYEKIKAGASLVQLYTALVFQGPKLINNIIKELNNLVLTDGFNNISEVIGKSS